MDQIQSMKAFVSVAKHGSFTKAAQRLGTSNQLMSKYVSQLEEHLGVRLFNRTTRKVHLTEAGEQCFEQAKHVLESLKDMESHFGQLKNEVEGQLRISSPVTFSTLHLARLINDFKKAYPGVTIDLQLNDRKVDVIEEGYDVALRIGNLKSSSLIAKKICPIRLVVCASPEYLTLNGHPSHPDELNPDHYLRYSYMEHAPSKQPLLEALRRSNQKTTAALSCNNGEVLMAAAIAGEGYVFQPTFIVSEAVKRGKLDIILPSFEPEALGLYAVYPHRKLLAPTLRAFIDFLSQYYGDEPYWDKLT